MFSERYKGLNASQKQAVDTIEGPVMVVAGPGTGKTELLSVRAANILQKTDTLPENILCLTFTESGQSAMRERLVGIIGKDAYKVAIHTFHSFGSEIISHNREFFYQSALFEPADELKQYELLREIFENLAPSDPLASKMNGEYTHQSDAQKVISELKQKSALTSDELHALIQQSEASLDFIEKRLAPIFADKIVAGTGPKIIAVMDELRAHAASLETMYAVRPLGQVIVESIETMLAAAEVEHPTKPITAWKNAWLEKDARNTMVFKDRKRLVKLRSLASIYYQYLGGMEKKSLYDYDDMIMQVVHAIEVYDDLKFNLQEKYLYIMVDEFQDTNPAQLRLLHNLTDNPVNEGTPNVLVVGDDDQAIYGFQGADSSNILSFVDTYPSRQLIVLTDNYRSQADILEASRAVITQGTDRLENRIPELDKQLSAKRTGKGNVNLLHAETSSTERHGLVKRIQASIAAGTDPSSIAVLARRHSDLESLVPYFHHYGIAIRYEREESILDSEPIKALEQLVRVVHALAEGQHSDVQALMPELLAHPAWNIAPIDLWRLSLDAHHAHQHWMETMASTPRFVEIHAWLLEQAQASTHTPLEPMVDQLFGTPETPDTPYYRYYFSKEKVAEQPSTYLDHLQSLRTLRTKLREYQPGSGLSLGSLIEYIDLYRKLGIGMMAHRYTLASDVPAVQLLTAHKSKGLEFDSVYVYSALDSVWGQSARTRSRSVSYPANLPLAPAGDTADERLRLFYVAMTRAKNELVLTYSDTNDAAKHTLLADFLVSLSLTQEEVAPTNDEILETAELAWYAPYVEPTQDLKVLLAPQLERFKLSPTSLNGFLDVTRGGPEAFLLNNLLHFPKAKSPAAAFGTAVHWTMQQAHTHLSATGEQKPLEDMLHDFEVALARERLDPKDYTQYVQKGSDAITQFVTSGKMPFTPEQKAEVSFSHQDVRIGDAKITGALDVVTLDKTERTMVVTDYKTGKPSEVWDKGDDYTKIKLHKYRQQLLFYKLLVEESSEYGTYKVVNGQLAFIEPNPAGETVVLDLSLEREDVAHTKQLIEAVWRHISTLDLPDTSAYPDSLKGILAFEQDLIDGTV